MGEAKQRKENAKVAKFVEASEQERVALANLLEATRPKGEVDQRRWQRLYDDFEIEPVDVAREKADLKAVEEAQGDPSRKQPVRISQFSADLEEFETTADTIEFYLNTMKTTDLPGAFLKYLNRIRDRMEGKDGYTAPSQKVVEIAADPPPAEAPST